MKRMLLFASPVVSTAGPLPSPMGPVLEESQGAARARETCTHVLHFHRTCGPRIPQQAFVVLDTTCPRSDPRGHPRRQLFACRKSSLATSCTSSTFTHDLNNFSQAARRVSSTRNHTSSSSKYVWFSAGKEDPVERDSSPEHGWEL